MQTDKNNQCIMFLSMIYILILFASAMIGNKIIAAPFHVLGSFSAGSLTGPFWFILSDVIAEVYGWRTSSRMFVAAMIVEFIFICITSFMIHLPSPTWWHLQDAYNFIMGHLFQLYWAQLAGIVIAWYLNVKLLTYWKFLLRGKYFWLRSIGASGIGEIIFSIISVSLSSIGLVPFSELPKIVLCSCLLKIIFSIVFSYPATLAVALLSYIEKIEPDTYDDVPPLQTTLHPRLISP